MAAFLVGHAAHPDWRVAMTMATLQIEQRRAAHEASAAGPLNLGFVYFSDHYASQAQALYAALREQWPGLSWVGCVGTGVAAGGVEYIDEPALVLMLAALPAGRFEVFSGARKLQGQEPWTALVHADPATPDLAELIGEMSDRTASGYLFGGLASSRGAAVHVADGVWQGGLSGVAFSRDVGLLSRVTQGCQPLGPVRTVTACQRNLITTLDNRPALPCLLEDLGIHSLDDPHQALPRLRATLVGLTDAHDAILARPGQFGADTRVRHLVGLDPERQAVAVSDLLQPGMKLAFCQRDVDAARRSHSKAARPLPRRVEGARPPPSRASRGDRRECTKPGGGARAR